MIQAIFWLVLVGIVTAGGCAFLSHEQGIGAAKQLAADKPVIDACVVDKKKAIDANVSLQADVKRMAGEQAVQNAAVADLQDAYAASLARKTKAQVANQTKLAALQSDQASVIQAAAKSLTGLTCTQVVKKVADDLHQVAVREYEDRPPTQKPAAPARGGLSVE